MSEVDANDLAAVIADVQLDNVRLLQSNVTTQSIDTQRVPTANLLLTHGTKILHRHDGGFLVGAKVEARVVAADQGDTVPPLVRMDVTLELRYSLADPGRFDDKVLEAFARLNGAFNAWPYWREYFQTTAARMQLPPLILPVFRIEQRKPESAAKVPTGSSASTEDTVVSRPRKQRRHSSKSERPRRLG